MSSSIAPETSPANDDQIQGAGHTAYAKIKERIRSACINLGPITDRLEEVKTELDAMIDLGIEDIQDQEDFVRNHLHCFRKRAYLKKTQSYITRIGDIEKPEPIEDFVKTIHNVDSVERMRALFTVQAIHSALEVAETISRLTAHSITALDGIACQKLPYDLTLSGWENSAILQEVQRAIGKDLSKVYGLRLGEAVQSYDSALNVYKEKESAVNEELFDKFKDAGDEKRKKILAPLWKYLVSGTEASRSLSVQKRKLESLLHLLRWPWIEELEHSIELLKGIKLNLEQLHQRLMEEESESQDLDSDSE
ncbi:hypothetical protein SLS59_008560 [Nothophoma quercina]|uniref:Uncharacterized protein n=1 Tax=Nothophoma quercina TaxID=749835 RepID=A0ABR3QRK8_9PLEO